MKDYDGQARGTPMSSREYQCRVGEDQGSLASTTAQLGKEEPARQAIVAEAEGNVAMP